MAELKHQIQTSFKLSGLTVRLEGCRYLAGLLGPVQQEDRQAWIDKILEHLLATNLTTDVVDKAVSRNIIRSEELTRTNYASTRFLAFYITDDLIGFVSGSSTGVLGSAGGQSQYRAAHRHQRLPDPAAQLQRGAEKVLNRQRDGQGPS